jgi:hypothetical protein
LSCAGKTGLQTRFLLPMVGELELRIARAVGRMAATVRAGGRAPAARGVGASVAAARALRRRRCMCVWVCGGWGHTSALAFTSSFSSSANLVALAAASSCCFRCCCC